MRTEIYIRRTILALLFFCAALVVTALIAACDESENQVTDTRTMVPDPSWDCSMPAGIPAPENGELVLEADMTLGVIYDIGQTPYGRRHLIEVTGGTLKGPKINAEFLAGGLDYQLTLSNGAMEVDQVNVLQTSDGSYIYFRNCGVSADAGDVRVVPDFEAPNQSPYRFLNRGKFVGTRELDIKNKTMKMKIYDVSNVKINPDGAEAVKVVQPEDVPDQSWECREAAPSEKKGDELFTETVGLDAENYISVGRSKYGSRNIALITGGTVTGGIQGRVLFGGADYQLMKSATANLDARYTIETSDGERIIVRNCGRGMAPVPTFETRVDGNYNYLNDGLWLSSAPSPSRGSVAITIFESIMKR